MIMETPWIKNSFEKHNQMKENILSLIVYYDDDDLQILALIFLWGEIDPPDYSAFIYKEIALVVNTVQIKCIYKGNWTCLLKIFFNKIEFIHLSHKMNSLTWVVENKSFL